MKLGNYSQDTWTELLKKLLNWYDAPRVVSEVVRRLRQGSEITIDTSNFDNNLSEADDTIQKALETIDDLVIGGGGSIDQDNKIKQYSLIVSDANDLSVVATALNARPQFTVADDEILLIKPNSIEFGDVVLYFSTVVLLKNLGKGTYGAGSGVTLTENDLTFIGNINWNNDIATLAETQIINLGDVGSNDIVTAFNAHTFNGGENPVQEQSEGYVLIDVIIDAEPLQYLFVGTGGEYGVGGTETAIEDDFVLLTGNMSDGTPGLQEVLNVSGYAESSDGNNSIRVRLNPVPPFTPASFNLEFSDDISGNNTRFNITNQSIGFRTTGLISLIASDIPSQPVSLSTDYVETPSLVHYPNVSFTHIASINTQTADTTGNIDYTTESTTGTALPLSDNIAGKIFNEETPYVYEDDPFSVINLKTGGYVINYIDTTGSTDFPTVTNAFGDVTQTKGDAFREDAVFKMIVSTDNGEDVEVFYVDAYNTSGGGAFIPLSGTEVGSPVTGLIELGTNQLNNGFVMPRGDKFAYNGIDDTGLPTLAILDDVNGIYVQAYLEPNGINLVGYDEENFKGFYTDYYYGANYDDNTYVQKKYVDDLTPSSTASTTILLDNAIVGRIYNEATPSTADNFTTDDLIVGGKAINFIDTTGDSDFPTVNSATTGFIEGAPFEAGEIYMMVIQSFNGTTYRYYFIKV